MSETVIVEPSNANYVKKILGTSAALYGFELGSDLCEDAGPVGRLVGGTLGALLFGYAGSALGTVIDDSMMNMFSTRSSNSTQMRDITDNNYDEDFL